LRTIAIDEAEIARSSCKNRINFVKGVDEIIAVPPAKFEKSILKKSENECPANFPAWLIGGGEG
jgi:hypothetical protein